MRKKEAIKMKKRGFTLIELMIVIAIIAILAAILVPNFLKARAQAQFSACIQSIKNISVAVEMYKTETGDFPLTSNFESKLTPNYIKSWPKCASGGTAIYYERCDGWGAPYTNQDYGIYCPGTLHKAAGITTNNRPLYLNRYGWYIRD